MSINSLRGNLKHMKDITREMYVFQNQLDSIKKLESNSMVVLDTKEKKLLVDVINSLKIQLRILNNSIPGIMQNIGFYKKLATDKKEPGIEKITDKLVEIKYSPLEEDEKISLIISDKEKKEFLENLSKSSFSKNQIKKKYSAERQMPTFGKPSAYAMLANRIFRNTSSNLVEKGYFERLNKNLRTISSPFLVMSYVSMIFLTVLISFILGIALLIFLLYFNVSALYPFINLVNSDESIILRLVKLVWIVFIIPLATGFLMYLYPRTEGKNMGSKIDQELPFVTIHMSAIASSGVEPLTIFKIILKSEEYFYTNSELRKLMNLINFQGKDMVGALKTVSRTSPSAKLRDLLDGMATSITSGGSLVEFLDKHAENLLLDYRLERERYTKTSETFMDIYISIVIAAPMIFLMLFIIMGSTGMLSNFIGLSVNALNLLLVMAIVFLNISFLIFLRYKQPVM